MMLMFMKCKCNYVSLTPGVLHSVGALKSLLELNIDHVCNDKSVLILVVDMHHIVLASSTLAHNLNFQSRKKRLPFDRIFDVQ